MISSEVQRTLVKSPPELWAELSDPEALARHLSGEFGEIRITATDEERRVEWAADGASGTVELKPSGWGTKVRLQASREPLREEPAEAEPPPAQASEPPEAAQLPVLAAEAPDAEPLPAPPPEAETPGVEPELAAQPPSLPAPLSAWAQQIAQAESLIEARAVPARPPAAIVGQTQDALAAAAQAEPKSEPADTHVAAAERPEPDQESRRGIFARLFGRRKQRPEHDQARRPTPHSSANILPAEPEAPLQGTAEPNPEFSMKSIEALQARYKVAGAATPAPVPAAPAPAALTSLAATAIPLPPAAPAAAPALSAPAPAPPPNELAPHTPEPEPDISAELRAAEEVAAEEVKAVLSAALDSLGAAHHRPFSRS
jgi:hypothetical protein